jgi:hypothetical protein
VRGGIFCSLIEPPWTLHPLRSSRSSNRTDWRVTHGGCMPVRPRRTARGGDHWTMAGRRLSHYRSRASPRRKLPAFTKFAGSSGCRVRASGIHLAALSGTSTVSLVGLVPGCIRRSSRWRILLATASRTVRKRCEAALRAHRVRQVMALAIGRILTNAARNQCLITFHTSVVSQ